jgi:hypothetical protein
VSAGKCTENKFVMAMLIKQQEGVLVHPKEDRVIALLVHIVEY